jgi:hypothetical protein
MNSVEGGIIHFEDKGRRHRDLHRNIRRFIRRLQTKVEEGLRRQ